MDVLAGVAALALVGVYLLSRRTRLPPKGPLAATPTSIAELSPSALRSTAENHARVPANVYAARLSSGSNLGLGYTPGHDRIDVYAPIDDEASEFAAFEFSLASRRWLTDPPPSDDQIKAIIKDTFPG